MPSCVSCLSTPWDRLVPVADMVPKVVLNGYWSPERELPDCFGSGKSVQRPAVLLCQNWRQTLWLSDISAHRYRLTIEQVECLRSKRRCLCLGLPVSRARPVSLSPGPTWVKPFNTFMVLCIQAAGFVGVSRDRFPEAGLRPRSTAIAPRSGWMARLAGICHPPGLQLQQDLRAEQTQVVRIGRDHRESIAEKTRFLRVRFTPITTNAHNLSLFSP